MPDVLLLAKVSVLLAVTLVAARAMRRGPASARHLLWSAAFAGLLALPILSSSLPSLAIDTSAWKSAAPVVLETPPAPAPTADVIAAFEPAPDDRGVAPSPSASVAVARRRLSLPPLADLMFAVWAAGALAGLATLALGLRRADRLARAAVPIGDAGWHVAAAAAAAGFGLRRTPRILMSEQVVTPMAGGLLRPTVFVPAVARAWDAERRDIVLAHEIAHLAGRDPLRQIVARVALAIYWFHPFAWLAVRQAEAAREQACDEAVLSRGTRPSAYARVLLEFADGLPAAGPAVAALPIVQRSLLERRLMAILSTDVRPRGRGRILLPAIAIALVALPLAAAHPAEPGVSLVSARANANLDAPAPADAPRPADPAAPLPASAGSATIADAPAAAAQSSCWWKDGDGNTFQGSITISGDQITERAGRMGGTRVMQQTFGDTRVCMLAEGVGDREGGPSTWLAHASRVVIETRRGSDARGFESQGSRVSWRVNGAERAADADAAAWRTRVLAVLDPAWELTMLRGEESSLQGEISSIHGERSSLQGEISSLYGEVSSMRGEISSIRGEESSLRGEISSIYGELSSLQGEISSHRGDISSLTASRYDASDAERARIAERIRRHEAEIARIEKQIREFDVDKRVAEVERRLQSFDSDRKAAEIERRLRAFDVESKVKALQSQIERLDVDGKVAAIERRMQGLDAERRGAELRARIERAVRDLNR